MTELRIGWASPWNGRSAIAHSASEVAFELSQRGHTVTVLRTEVGEALRMPARPAPGEIASLADCTSADLRQSFDVVVAHIGDHYAFHGALPSRMPELDCVGIFHDALLADLAIGFARDETTMRSLVRQTYGEDIWPAGTPFFDDLGEVMQRRPMLEWLAQYTAGAVAHSKHYSDRLRRSCPGPMQTIPLAFTVAGLPAPPLPSGKVTVAVLGRANSNKRIDQLILAIAASPLLRGRCQIRSIGEVTEGERERLSRVAQMARIPCPEFTGWVSEDDLRRKLCDVDFISCLRNPVLEGASASLVLALSSGRPTLVSAHGCYAELPEDAALFCAPDKEARDVMLHLEKLICDPQSGQRLGERGKSHALTAHSPARYADMLLPLLEKVIALQPWRKSRRQMLGTLSSFGLSSDDPAAGRVSDIQGAFLSAEEK